MNKFNVKAGYYEWMIFREDTLICTIDDGSNSLAESVTAPDGEGLISVDDLYDLSVECLAGIRLAAQEDGAKVPFTDAEQAEIAPKLFIAWARHFGYEESDICKKLEYNDYVLDDRYSLGEVIYDITACIPLFTGRGCKAEHYEYDSRDLYTCIFEWAKEFEAKYPDSGFDYLTTVEDFAREKLREYFEL